MIKGGDAVIIVHRREQFRALDFRRLKGVMKQAVLVDSRSVYRPEELPAFVCYGVRRGGGKVQSAESPTARIKIHGRQVFDKPNARALPTAQPTPLARSEPPLTAVGAMTMPADVIGPTGNPAEFIMLSLAEMIVGEPDADHRR